jgi:hypothetical protein
MRRFLALLLLPSLAFAGDFVTNPSSTLPGPKSDARALPVGSDPNKYLRAPDFNALRDAANDLRDYVRAPNDALVTSTGGTTARRLADHLATLPDTKPYLTDTAASTSHVIAIDHNGAGATQAYALNIWNRADNAAAPTADAGAKAAIVVHQYSDADAAVVIDNTRMKPLLRLRNARNETNSTGTYGQGHFLELYGYSATATYPGDPVRLGYLANDLAFVSVDTSRPWTFSSTQAAPALKLIQSGAAQGLQVVQNGAGIALDLSQNGAGNGLRIQAAAGAAGQYPALVTGYDYGPKFTTSQNSGVSLWVQKDGTGAGDAFIVTNKGTGKSLDVRTAVGSVAHIWANGEVEILTAGAGIYMKSPDGTRYKLTIANGGTVNVAAAP